MLRAYAIDFESSWETHLPLRTKEIPIVKVQWKHHNEREASWELESEIHKKFPYLFNVQD